MQWNYIPANRYLRENKKNNNISIMSTRSTEYNLKCLTMVLIKISHHAER